MTAEVRPTNCHFCGYLCGLLATVEDGRVTALEPDPSRYPYDPKVIAGCRRWRKNLDVLDAPDRVNHPMRRSGPRGKGTWSKCPGTRRSTTLPTAFAAFATGTEAAPRRR